MKRESSQEDELGREDLGAQRCKEQEKQSWEKEMSSEMSKRKETTRRKPREGPKVGESRQRDQVGQVRKIRDRRGKRKIPEADYREVKARRGRGKEIELEKHQQAQKRAS